MMIAKFNLEDPPNEPPDGANPLVWQLASALRAAHQPDITSCCVTCRGSVAWPCPPSRLAAKGYRLALRIGQA
jgi:hypothetical protein